MQWMNAFYTIFEKYLPASHALATTAAAIAVAAHIVWHVNRICLMFSTSRTTLFVCKFITHSSRQPRAASMASTREREWTENAKKIHQMSDCSIRFRLFGSSPLCNSGTNCIMHLSKDKSRPIYFSHLFALHLDAQLRIMCMCAKC